MNVSQFNEPKIIDALIAEAQPVELHGATCDTYYARMHGRRVFIKRLKEEFRFNPRYLSALEKEFKIGYRLEHKALPRYISFEHDAIVMDYVEGVTLAQFVTENPGYFSSKKNVFQFMMQLLDGIKYLHQNSILHLDLKPENIMISHIGNDVHIVDLGFCYSDAYNETTGYTQSFAAPEQMGECQEKVGTYTDVFAIGKILEYALAGQKHNRYLSIAKKCQNEQPQNRPDVETLLSLFSYSEKREKALWVSLLSVIALIIGGIFIYDKSLKSENISQSQSVAKTIQNITDSAKTEDTTNITIDKVSNSGGSTNNNRIENNKPTPQATYKYPATDYPFQSKHSTMEVKRDWYRELRPIYDKLLDHYLAVDSIAWFNDAFRECSYQLIKDKKSLVYKNHNNISTDDIYNDGMHVFTMISWMHQGFPVEISGYNRPPRPDLTKYANEQISLFETL